MVPSDKPLPVVPVLGLVLVPELVLGQELVPVPGQVLEPVPGQVLVRELELEPVLGLELHRQQPNCSPVPLPEPHPVSFFYSF